MATKKAKAKGPEQSGPSGRRLYKTAKKSAEQSARSGRGLHQVDTDELSVEVRDDPLFQQLAISEIQTHLQQWHRTSNGAFVWRAYRVARHLPFIPPLMQEALIVYLDECAGAIVTAGTPSAVAQALRLSNPLGATGEGNQAANKQSEDYWLWVNYQSMTRVDKLTGKPRMDGAAAHRILADEFATTGPAIKQRLLRIEKKGQYKDRSRKSR